MIQYRILKELLEYFLQIMFHEIGTCMSTKDSFFDYCYYYFYYDNLFFTFLYNVDLIIIRYHLLIKAHVMAIVLPN